MPHDPSDDASPEDRTPSLPSDSSDAPADDERDENYDEYVPTDDDRLESCAVWFKLRPEDQAAIRALPHSLLPQQRIVHLLMRHMLKSQARMFAVKDAAASFLVAAPLVSLIVIGCLWVLLYLVSWGLQWLPDGVFNSFLYVLFIFSAFLFRFGAQDELGSTHPVGFSTTREEMVWGFRMYRIETIQNWSNLGVMCLILTVVAQWFLIHFARSHAGVPDYGGLKDGLYLSIDNLLGAVCYDVYDIYGLTVNRTIAHTPWTATLFFYFRLCYVPIVFILLLNGYRRFQVSGLFRDFESVGKDYDRLIEWLEDPRRAAGGWTAPYLNEYLFFRITGAYLRGDFEHVRRLTERFSRLDVSLEVRELFVDRDGRRIFVGYVS